MILILVGIWPSRKLIPGNIILGRWVALVPAHNEDNVISNTVKCLLKEWKGYLPLRVIVIADNCTDNTFELAKMAGAEVWERKGKPGKQNTLKWAFEKLKKEEDEDTVVTVIDADNVVEEGYFENLGAGLIKSDVVQSYIKTMNLRDNIQTMWYGVNYAYMMRFIYLGRQRLGRSAVLGGTGWAMRIKVLNGCPWYVESLTDDLEYSILLRLAGYRVKYVSQAVIQDEKPILFLSGIRQRLRWMRGQWQCFIKYFFRLLLIDGEMAIYVALPFLALISVILMVMYGVSFKGFIIVLALYALACILEGVSGALPGVILVVPFYFLSLLINVYALFTYKSKNWQRTLHKGVKIE